MRRCLTLTTLALTLMLVTRAEAHFPWLVTEPAEQPKNVKLYFSETASPDDPELLDRLLPAEVWLASDGRAPAEPLTLKKEDDALQSEIPEKRRASTVALRQTYGVISRGGETFLLKYYAKTHPSSLPGTWNGVEDAERMPLEIMPELQGETLLLTVRWQGKPLPEATVTIEGPGLTETLEATTDDQGAVRCPVAEAGLFSIRARHVVAEAGKHEEMEYASVRHYSTLSLNAAPSKLTPVTHAWPPLPKGVTSFGAAVAGDSLYLYGGHYGQAHHYSREGQSGDLLSLNLRNPQQWDVLPGGPKLTGLAMVAFDNKLYRVGGFTAENGDAEDQVLHSQSGFARFDPATKKWEDLTRLPEGRSSHDAAFIGNTLYVVGGWDMQGDQETKWHDTAWSADLTAPTIEWKPIAAPPFQRRAVALAEWQGKLYCLGGMQQEGGTTTAVAIYDPATNQWSEGPALLGPPMDGFGASTFASQAGLYATTMSGAIQRLSPEGDRWEFAGQLAHPRFFHRQLPWQANDLIIVGGASMATGKIDALELLQPEPATPAVAGQ